MTNPVDRIRGFHADLIAFRQDMHAHPELAFQETRTSDRVADQLASWGIEVHRGLAKTGLVGVIRGKKSGTRSVGLRADMDCLPMHETAERAHRSQNAGRMHACGHDGHTTMLLGAARYLSETRAFEGTAHVIFQPAEEHGGGGNVMVREGLFERFPADQVYARPKDEYTQALLAAVPVPDPRRMKERKAERRRHAHVLADAAEEAALADKK